MAAYCSSRIGHLKRVAHWLINVSRSYCRLGEKEKVEQLIDLAISILRKAMNDNLNSDYSDEYRQSVMAETNLAIAEKYLLIEKDYKKSLKYYLKALKGSIYLRFIRIISESLYGIYRASKNISMKDFIEIFNVEFDNLEELKKKSDPDNLFIQNVINFLNKINNIDKIEAVSQKVKKQGQAIWDNWANNKEHPISNMMEKEDFLKTLIPPKDS